MQWEKEIELTIWAKVIASWRFQKLVVAATDKKLARGFLQKRVFLIYFSKFTGKHQRRNLFFHKVADRKSR